MKHIAVVHEDHNNDQPESPAAARSITTVRVDGQSLEIHTRPRYEYGAHDGVVAWVQSRGMQRSSRREGVDAGMAFIHELVNGPNAERMEMPHQRVIMTSSPSLTQRALTDVVRERERQDAQHGQPTHDLSVWAAVIGEEFGEFCQALLQSRQRRGDTGHVREELLHIAASAVAAVEAIDAGSTSTGHASNATT